MKLGKATVGSWWGGCWRAGAGTDYFACFEVVRRRVSSFGLRGLFEVFPGVFPLLLELVFAGASLTAKNFLRFAYAGTPGTDLSLEVFCFSFLNPF